MRNFESDLTSFSAKRDFNRRQMLATSLAVGFAAAVQPVCAQTAITTDSNGLAAGEVKIPVADGEIPAYRAMPEKGGPFPLVLVVQEIFGVHEHIKDICRRLAREGYMAIAAELYARQGSVAGMTDIQEIISKVVSQVPDAQVISDLDAVVAYAKATGSADTARLGVTGFCWGGRITGSMPSITRPSRPASPGTASLSAIRARKRRSIRSISHATSRRRCSASMARPTKAFPSTPSNACGLRAKRRARLANSSSIRIHRTPSTRITGRATAKARRRMAGPAC